MRVEFPKTHALLERFTLVERSAMNVPDDVREAGRLTHYAVRARYPGLEDVTEKAYQEALALARRVVHWAEETIGVTKPK